jgi:hypothetical protein
MNPSEYAWYKEMLGVNYRIPDLTDQQIDKILLYEKEKAGFTSLRTFSIWEEADYERYVFQAFLTEDQLSVYTGTVAENIKFNEKAFIESDVKNVEFIRREEQRLNFYRNKFVPAVFSDHSILINIISQKEQTKINYLKDEYRRYLRKNKLDAIVYHFRHYRSLQPNQLKLTLILHEISSIWPDYKTFENHMDVPTKTVAYYLLDLIRTNPAWFNELLELQTNLLQGLQITNTDISVESIPGWHTAPKISSPEKERETMVMNFLLYDKEKYGIS